MPNFLPAERWARLESLFIAAADLDPTLRSGFIDAQCGADTELRDELLSLLKYDTAGQTEVEAALGAGAAWVVDSDLKAGAVLGAYRIERELGRGGMSVVYLAARDDGEFRKQVAVKLIKRGMDTDAVVERLRRERRILAGLEHPYIARLLDGGATSDARPFIVMEYVEGQPIDRYCHERGLNIAERCELMEKVCEAVSYAHRNLVVHRDLKPANILVDADGNPRLLDFGVARLLAGDPFAAGPETRTQAFTPEYASPEQLAGAPSGTSTDIYSLGVVLYELLAGIRPVVQDPIQPVSAAAAHAGRSGHWAKELRDDLDNLLAKALEKDPARRYLSVEQFQQDLGLHRRGLPISARGDSILYRGGKFLKRHRFAAIAAAAAILATFAGLVATLSQARIATQQREVAERRRLDADHERQRAEEQSRQSAAARLRAEAEHAEAERQRTQAEAQKTIAETQRAMADRRFDQVRELARKFTTDIYDSIAQLPGATPARRMVVETGLKYYDSLAKDAQGNRDLLEEVARGYDKMGDVQGNPYYPNLGDLPGALASYRKALAIRNGIDDPSAAFIAARLQGHMRMAQALIGQGDYGACERLLREAAQFGEAAAANPATGKEWGVRNGLANIYATLGDLKVRQGLDREAVEPYEKQLEIRTGLLKDSDPVPGQAGVGISETKLGEAWSRSGHPIEALPHLRRADEINRKLAAENPRNMGLVRMTFVSSMLIAETLATPQGKAVAKPGETASAFEAALAVVEKLAAADPQNRQPLLDIAETSEGYEDYLIDEKNPQAAVAAGRRSLTAMEKLAKISPLAGGNVATYIEVLQKFAGALSLARQFDEANERLRAAEEMIGKNDAVKPRTRGEFLQTKGDVLAAQNRPAEAAAGYKEAAAIFETEFAKAPDNRYWADALPGIYSRLADSYKQSGDTKQANEALQKAQDRYREIESKRPLTPDEQKSRDALANRTAHQ